MTPPCTARIPPSRGGRISLPEIWMVVLLGLFGYGLYSLVTAFSFSGLLLWLGIWFAAFIFLGWLAPDWSDLEGIQKVYESMETVLDQPERKMYREEIDRTLKRMFQVRDETKKTRELLKQFPLGKLRRDVEAATADLAGAVPGSEAAERIRTRLSDLQETLGRLETQAKRLDEFEEMKKTWVASMGNLRVRLETNPTTAQATDGDEILQELTSLNRITAAVDEGKPILPSSANMPPVADVQIDESNASRQPSKPTSERPESER